MSSGRLRRVSRAILVNRFLCGFPGFPVWGSLRNNLNRLGVLRIFVHNLRRCGLPRRIAPSGYADCFWISDDWTDNYFHFLFDAYPRLHALRSGLGSKTLLLPAVCRERSYIREVLAALNQEAVYLENDRVYWSAQDLHFCETTGERYFKVESVACLEGLKSVLLEGLPEEQAAVRLYVSRSEAPARRVLNEDELLPELTAAGFQVVKLEQLTLAQQVSLFDRAEWVIGPHGAGFANLGFARPGCRLLEFKARGSSVNSLYQELCRTMGHSHEYLDCEPTLPDIQATNYVVPLDALRSYLKRHALS